MESPRMGPNLPYKPTSQSRKTNHPNVHLRAVKRATHKAVKRAFRVHHRTGKQIRTNP